MHKPHNLEINMSFAANLRKLRRDKGWTQHDLAEASGVKASHIPRLEKENSDPKLSTIYKLIKALECTPDALILDNKNMSIDGIAKVTMERISHLPDDDKAAITHVVDHYCSAIGIRETLSKEKKGIMPQFRYMTKPNEDAISKDQLEKIK